MVADRAVRSSRLPTGEQVGEVLGPVFAETGFEVEGAVVDTRATPARIVVTADGDADLTLDALAALSVAASAALDRLDGLDGAGDLPPYVLEVTSPGAERTLTADRHFRRARGRRVALTLADGTQLTGRLGESGAETLAVVLPGRGGPTVKVLDRSTIVEATVQVEFAPPNRRELELALGSAPMGESPR